MIAMIKKYPIVSLIIAAIVGVWVYNYYTKMQDEKAKKETTPTPTPGSKLVRNVANFPSVVGKIMYN